MKLVVGLGNPGPRYVASRHNVGFRVVAALARSQGLDVARERFLGRFVEGTLPAGPGETAAPDAVPTRLGMLLPLTFMNRSGASVAAALEQLPGVDPARDLVVVYDDLDLPLGRLRLRPDGGAGGHRGMADVLDAVGSRDVPRVRFGIGRPAEPGDDARGEVVDFVLDAFSSEEEQLLAERIPLAADAAVSLLRDGATTAMDRYNAAFGP